MKLLTEEEIKKLNKEELINYICQLQEYSQKLDVEEKLENPKRKAILVTTEDN